MSTTQIFLALQDLSAEFPRAARVWLWGGGRHRFQCSGRMASAMKISARTGEVP